ncbi:MAG: hypothetical protein AAF797_08305 [Planctomycetota bacterium]
MLALPFAFAWVWMTLGVVSGAVLGLGFHKAGHMGGYSSWRRRLARLGHIAFFGTGLLCLAWGVTAMSLGLDSRLAVVATGGFIAGAVAMPTVCFLAAWRKPFRHLFFMPVLSLLGAVLLAAWLSGAACLASL